MGMDIRKEKLQEKEDTNKDLLDRMKSLEDELKLGFA